MRNESKTVEEQGKVKIVETHGCASFEIFELFRLETHGCASLQENHPPVIIDALFGSGLNRPLEGVYADVVKQIIKLMQL